MLPEVSVVLAAPGHGRQAWVQRLFGFDEANLAAVEKQLHQRLFPAAETEHLDGRRQRTAMTALQAEPVDQHFRGAWLTGFGADITRVAQQAGVYQLGKAHRLAP
ncbi:hypothetical protein D3C71_1792830 [compost metagenome]